MEHTMTPDLCIPGAIFERPQVAHYRTGFRAARLVRHQTIMMQAGERKRLTMCLLAWAKAWNRTINEVHAIYSAMQKDGLCTWTIEDAGLPGDHATFEWSDAYVRETDPIAAAYEAGQADGYEAGQKAGYMAGYRARRNGSNGSDELLQNPLQSDYNGFTDPQYCADSDSVPESVSLETTVPDSTESVPESAQPVRVAPPLSVVEQFVAVGMERDKAEARVQEFGESRCRDALDSLRFKQEGSKVPKPVGYLVDFLIHQRPLPAGLVKRRKEVKPPPKPKAPPRAVVRTAPVEELPTPPLTPEHQAWLETMLERTTP